MLTDADRAAAKELVGYCEKDNWYTYFNTETDPAACEKCGGKFTHKVGFQLTTQRTFDSSKMSADQKRQRQLKK